MKMTQPKRQRNLERNLKSLEETRREKRESILFFKRNDKTMNIYEHIEDASGDPIAIQEMLKSIAVIAVDLSGNDPGLQFAAAVKLRFLLSVENPSVDEIIGSGVVPRLVEFLGEQHGSLLPVEAATALCAITSGTLEQANIIIADGAIPKFVRLLTSDNDALQKLAVLALGSVANQSTSCRDLVLGHGALTPLLDLPEKYTDPPMLHNPDMLQRATRTLAILCSRNPLFDQVKSALPTLQRLIQLNPGVLLEVCEDACLTLSCLSKGTVEQIQTVIDANICERLVMLLLHPQRRIVEFVIQTVGNIFKGSDLQIQVLIENGVFPCLRHILTHGAISSTLKKTCWAISNVTAGNRSKIQKVIDANIIPPLLHILQDEDYEAEVKQEAVRALSNATLRGSSEQIQLLVNHGCIGPLCDHLLCPDSRTVNPCLVRLRNILKVGDAKKDDGINLYAQMIKDLNGIHKIENLQLNPDNGVMATLILKRYWEREDG